MTDHKSSSPSSDRLDQLRAVNKASHDALIARTRDPARCIAGVGVELEVLNAFGLQGFDALSVQPAVTYGVDPKQTEVTTPLYIKLALKFRRFFPSDRDRPAGIGTWQAHLVATDGTYLLDPTADQFSG